MESPPLMDLPDIVQWARKVAKHLDRGFEIQDVSELGAAPQYARIEVQEAGGDASKPYTFSVNRLKGSHSVQLEIERELRKRLCPVCDARAESAPLADSDGFQIDCSVCGPFTIAGSLAVLFRSARTNGNVSESSDTTAWLAGTRTRAARRRSSAERPMRRRCTRGK